MMPNTLTESLQSIPLPKDVRHQRFADLVLRGRSLLDAYLSAGFKAKGKAAKSAASRLRQHPDVNAYITAIQKQSAEESLLTVQEKRSFLARVVRTRHAEIDPRDPEDPNGDMIVSVSETTGEVSNSLRVEKYSALKAIEIDNKMAGHNAPDKMEHSASGDLAALMMRIRANRDQPAS